LLTETSQPRLLQLLDFDRPEGGSFTPMIGGLLRDAMARGWAVGVVTFETAADARWIPEFKEAGVTVDLVPHGSDRELGSRLSEIVSSHEGPTVLHSHFHGFDFASLRVKKDRRDVVVVWHVHSTFSRNPLRVLPAMLKFGVFGRRVDAIFCPADNIVESAQRRLAPRDRVHFVPSAISIERFRPATAEERRTARERLEIPDGVASLLHFGWHRHLKGGDLFVDALAVLVDGGEPVVGLERGGGDEYSKQADQLGVAAALRVLDPISNVRELHAAADVLVSPSRKEGMAYALLESLAVGTPVVATPIPGHAYLGRHMAACRMSTTAPKSIAAAVKDVLARDPEVVERERREAQEWIRDNLSIEVVAAQTVDRYEALLGDLP